MKRCPIQIGFQVLVHKRLKGWRVMNAVLVNKSLVFCALVICYFGSAPTGFGEICGAHIHFQSPASLCSDNDSCKIAQFCEDDQNPERFCEIATQTTNCICPNGFVVANYNQYRSGTGGNCAQLGCSVRAPDDFIRKQVTKHFLHSEGAESR